MKRKKESAEGLADDALFLGVDVGTQGVKAVIYDLHSKQVVGLGSKSYGLQTDPLRPGMAEQHPSIWWTSGLEAILDAIKKCSDIDPTNRSRIKGVGVSGQQHGLVVLDENKEVIRPAKLWCDVESAKEAEELSEKFGWKMGAAFTATKLLWLKRNEPENFAKIRHVMMPKDFFNYMLTGEIVTEASDASGTGYFDSANQCWDRGAMKAIDEELENWVPTLIKPNAKVGKLKSDVARKLFVLCGFEKNDVNVSCGGGDNAMSALGVGATRDGLMVASLGTSGTLFGYSSKSVFDPSGVICPFCDATGAYLPLMCTLNCTEVPENVRNTITSPPLTHEEITSLASQEPAGCNGLQVLPYFRGERTPNWPHASGALVGIRHDTMGKPGLVYRAALEGVTYSLLSGVNQMKTFTGVSRLKQLIVVGGGSHNDLWCQIIADSFGVPVSLPREVETAALGGALQAAAVHSGEDIASFVATHCPGMKRTIEPKLDTSTAALYQSAFERHEDFGKKLFG